MIQRLLCTLALFCVTPGFVGCGTEDVTDNGGHSIESIELRVTPRDIEFDQLSCEQDNDCRSSCYCDEGVCAPHRIGPRPPASYCAQPPTRPCSSDSDCRDACYCGEGVCSPHRIGPRPPASYCALPPPDLYEDDDRWQEYSSYSAPQLHNFHYAGDRDWVAVYIERAGTVRFQTKDLTHGTDTKLKVFAFDGATIGARLGVHDDLGGVYFDPDHKSSRIDLEVGANSSFLIKVIDKSDPNIYSNSHTLPSYTLHLSYL